MALKAVLDNLDGLADDQKGLYVERDGKYWLDVESVGGVALEDVSGLKTALGAERESVRKAREQIKAFEDIDPAKAREALAKVEEMADWSPDQKVKEQIDALKAQMTDAHGKETKALQDKIDGLMSQLEGALVTSKATAALSAEKGSIELLLPHVKSQTRMRQDDDGKFVVDVIDANGNPRIGDSAGKPMTIEQLVKEMKTGDTYARAFDGTGASGSGAPPNGGGGGTNGPHVLSEQDARNPAKYRAAKQAAEKAGQTLEIAEQ